MNIISVSMMCWRISLASSFEEEELYPQSAPEQIPKHCMSIHELFDMFDVDTPYFSEEHCVSCERNIQPFSRCNNNHVFVTININAIFGNGSPSEVAEVVIVCR